MDAKKSKIYHLFLVFAVLNLLAYQSFIGNPAFDIHNNTKVSVSDKIFNYHLSISVLLFITWLSYWIFRKRLTSKKLTWLHLLITFLTVFALPFMVLRFITPMPRRYYEYDNGFKLSDIYGTMTWSFIVVGLVLLVSGFLLIVNIKQASEKLELFDNGF